ncbi:MAG: hypothetical protein PUF92_10135, partial [Subdoligranulum variabile]|nr:hypothetical protein [Subdoligranulum variabile]
HKQGTACLFFAKQYGLAVEYRRNWFQEKYPYSMCPRGVVNGRGLEKACKSVPPYGNTAQFPPNGLSTAPAAAAQHLRCQNAR